MTGKQYHQDSDAMNNTLTYELEPLTNRRTNPPWTQQGDNTGSSPIMPAPNDFMVT